MRIIVHSPLGTALIRKSCIATLLKVSHIIADETVSIGAIGFFVEMVDKLETGSNYLKIKMLLNHLNPEEPPEANMKQYVEGYLKAAKEYDKLKHKTTEQVKWIKHYESSIIVAYKLWMKGKMEELKSEGIVSLRHLFFNDKNRIGVYYLEEDKGVHFVRELPYTMNMETLLNLTLPDMDCKKTLLGFHELFMNETILKDSVFVQASDAAANDVQYSYFYFAATITNINFLTTAELEVISNSFKNKLSSFRLLIDEWTLKCNVSEDLTAGISFFKDSIMPALLLLDQCFKEENVLHYNFHDAKLSNYFLYMGEITKSALLNYYTTMDLITHDKRLLLEEKMKSEGTFDRRIPMIIISKNKNIVLPRLTVEEGEPDLSLIKRKFIGVGE